jgi:hypothetical protein
MAYHTRTSILFGISQIPGTVNYILNQEKHHAKRSFAEEWKIFMKRHGLAKDED